MSTSPRGVSVQEAYTWYRENKLWVNRHYQRKLVWTVAEKQKLIDSILLGYPLPLILLAEKANSCYDIIDGMQRLNAIFTFIETSYSLESGKYFDLKVFLTAKLEGEKGSFILVLFEFSGFDDMKIISNKHGQFSPVFSNTS